MISEILSQSSDRYWPETVLSGFGVLFLKLFHNPYSTLRRCCGENQKHGDQHHLKTVIKFTFILKTQLTEIVACLPISCWWSMRVVLGRRLLNELMNIETKADSFIVEFAESCSQIGGFGRKSWFSLFPVFPLGYISIIRKYSLVSGPDQLLLLYTSEISPHEVNIWLTISWNQEITTHTKIITKQKESELK